MKQSNKEVIFEESERHFKVVIPVRFNWPLFILYSLALMVWLAMMIAVLIYLFRGLSSSFVLTILLIIWILVWLWFGRFLSGRWQYQAANREILFFDEKQLILRRPVSIFGLTTSYDIRHVSPIYFTEKHSCLAFDYAFLHVYFGHSLERYQAEEVIGILNSRYFPQPGDDD
jgi:hypothetical protein